MTIAFRPMAPDDRQFVLSGWSSSYRTSIYAGLISNARWAKVMHVELGAIIDAPGTSVIVACEPGEVDHENREFLYGFIAARRSGPPHVYYVNVKLRYRGRGIARGLFHAAGVDPTEPFTYAAGTSVGEAIIATCKCGRPRRDHDGALECQRFARKFPGVLDPVPAREAA